MYRLKSLITATPMLYWVGPLVPLAVLLLMPLLVWQLGVEEQRVQSLHRQTQLENTRWQRYLKLLSNAPMEQLVKSNSRTSLEVALHESAQLLQALPEVQIDVFTVVPGEAIDVDDDLGGKIKPIRIVFEATILHAPTLLNILGQFVEVAGWRVAEVRGCAVQRLTSEPRLATACAIDIYHWSWTSINNTDVDSP